jgi:hypothetical protein
MEKIDVRIQLYGSTLAGLVMSIVWSIGLCRNTNITHIDYRLEYVWSFSGVRNLQGYLKPRFVLIPAVKQGLILE